MLKYRPRDMIMQGCVAATTTLTLSIFPIADRWETLVSALAIGVTSGVVIGCGIVLAFKLLGHPLG